MNGQRKPPESYSVSARVQSTSFKVWNWHRKTSAQLEKRTFERPIFWGLGLIHGTPIVAASLVAGAIWLLALPWYWVAILAVLIVCGLWSPFFVACVK